MSHFLQRIAASVAPAHGEVAQARLQPTQGSAFMPNVPRGQHTAAPAVAGSPEVTETTIADARGGRTRIDSTGSLLPSMDTEFEGTKPVAGTEAASRRRDRYGDTLLPPIAEQAETVRRGEGAHPVLHRRDRSTEGGVDFGQEIVVENAGRASGKLQKAQTQASSIQPLLAPPSIPAQPRGQERPSAANRSDNLRRARPSISDEVHIHIGRIEVAAVTPAPPRPSAPAPRKSFSLDEYLRRGSGGR